jgi:hypothetical protein
MSSIRVKTICWDGIVGPMHLLARTPLMPLQYGSYASECYNNVTAYLDVGFTRVSVASKPIPELANKLRTGPLLVTSQS